MRSFWLAAARLGAETQRPRQRTRGHAAANCDPLSSRCAARHHNPRAPYRAFRDDAARGNHNNNNTRHLAEDGALPGEDPCHSRPYLLAHMNFARLRAPLDDPSMAEFRLALAPVNAMARATPGFVWSFDHEENDDSDPRSGVPLLERDPLVMPQLSVWTNVQALQHFAFKSGHAIYLKRRREWFFPPDPDAGTDAPFAVCWWRRRSEPPPTLGEAFERCQHLRENGPSPRAFDFATAKDYPMPER